MRRVIVFRDLKPEKGITYSRQHIARLEKAGRFPKHLKLGGSPSSMNAWDEPEIDAYLEALKAERDAETQTV
jgi:prophage regulatory protein